MKKIDIACIVDDDPIFVFATKRMMKMANFCNAFLVFHNGKEALDSLSRMLLSKEKMPDVILLDLNMPVMDGWQFLDEFIKIPASQPITIYIVTSSIDPDDIIKSRSYNGVNHYIVKPISNSVLEDILKDFDTA